MFLASARTRGPIGTFYDVMDRYSLKEAVKNRHSLDFDPKPCEINFSFYIEFSGPWIRLQGTEGLGNVMYTCFKKSS